MSISCIHRRVFAALRQGLYDLGAITTPRSDAAAVMGGGSRGNSWSVSAVHDEGGQDRRCVSEGLSALEVGDGPASASLSGGLVSADVVGDASRLLQAFEPDNDGGVCAEVAAAGVAAAMADGDVRDERGECEEGVEWMASDDEGVFIVEEAEEAGEESSAVPDAADIQAHAADSVAWAALQCEAAAVQAHIRVSSMFESAVSAQCKLTRDMCRKDHQDAEAVVAEVDEAYEAGEAATFLEEVPPGVR